MFRNIITTAFLVFAYITCNAQSFDGTMLLDDATSQTRVVTNAFLNASNAVHELIQKVSPTPDFTTNNQMLVDTIVDVSSAPYLSDFVLKSELTNEVCNVVTNASTKWCIEQPSEWELYDTPAFDGMDRWWVRAVLDGNTEICFSIGNEQSTRLSFYHFNPETGEDEEVFVAVLKTINTLGLAMASDLTNYVAAADVLDWQDELASVSNALAAAIEAVATNLPPGMTTNDVKSLITDETKDFSKATEPLYIWQGLSVPYNIFGPTNENTFNGPGRVNLQIRDDGELWLSAGNSLRIATAAERFDGSNKNFTFDITLPFMNEFPELVTNRIEFYFMTFSGNLEHFPTFGNKGFLSDFYNDIGFVKSTITNGLASATITNGLIGADAISTNNAAFVAAVTNCPVVIASADAEALTEWGIYGGGGTIGALLTALAAAVAALKKKKMPLYPVGGTGNPVNATLANGVLTVSPFAMAAYTPAANAAFGVALGALPSDMESGKARDAVLVIDCSSLTDGQEPTVTWDTHFHPRTDTETDLAIVEAGKRAVFYISEYATGEFAVGGWQETAGGNA